MGVAVKITGSLKGALSNTLKNEVPFRSHWHFLVLPVLGFCAYLSSLRFSPNRTNVESFFDWLVVLHLAHSTGCV